jgi:transposase
VHDDNTLRSQVEKLRRRFGLETVVFVVDRGMITEANLEALGEEERMAWITALKAPQVKKLVKEGSLQLSLFDQLNLAEIESADYPDERLVVCRNPLAAAERARKREDLLAATEALLALIKARVEGGTLRGAAQIGLAVGEVVNKRKVKKHFELEIADDRFDYRRREEQIAAEAALDGFYLLRTSVPAEQLSAPEVVRSYKSLAQAERAFRTLKGPELELRPIHHRLEQRVRAHAFLCMLAYYLEWHLRKAWAELLFDDERPPVPDDPVAKRERSPEAKRKASSKRTASGEPCHSFRSLINELALVVRNSNRVRGSDATFDTVTDANPTQQRALELIEQIPELA